MGMIDVQPEIQCGLMSHLGTCKSWRARRADGPDRPGRALLPWCADFARNPLFALVSRKTLGS